MSGLGRHLGPQVQPAVLDALIALTADPADEVRDWATFALGQHAEIDGPVVRAALHARLDDSYGEARHEAIAGLAKRGDLSVIPILIRELHRGVAPGLLDAAVALATPDLCDALERFTIALQSRSALSLCFAAFSSTNRHPLCRKML